MRDSLKRKKPSSVNATPEVADFISKLKKGCYLLAIINNGLDKLKDNMFAGQKIEKKKFPKYYIQKYQINNLHKLNLDSRTRLTYTLVAEESGAAVIVLEVLSHKKYNKRFGYK